MQARAGRIDHDVPGALERQIGEHVLNLARYPAPANAIGLRIAGGNLNRRIDHLHPENLTVTLAHNEADRPYAAVQVKQGGVTGLTQSLRHGLKEDPRPLGIDLKERIMGKGKLHACHLEPNQRISPCSLGIATGHIAEPVRRRPDHATDLVARHEPIGHALDRRGVHAGVRHQVDHDVMSFSEHDVAPLAAVGLVIPSGTERCIVDILEGCVDAARGQRTLRHGYNLREPARRMKAQPVALGGRISLIVRQEASNAERQLELVPVAIACAITSYWPGRVPDQALYHGLLLRALPLKRHLLVLAAAADAEERARGGHRIRRGGLYSDSSGGLLPSRPSRDDRTHGRRPDPPCPASIILTLRTLRLKPLQLDGNGLSVLLSMSATAHGPSIG